MSNTILIVDGDVARWCTAKQAITEKLKYNIVTASTGLEIIDLVVSDDSAVDLMLLDMCVPQIDVLHLIRFLRLHRSDFPIIVLTEYGDNVRATEAIHAGANDFLMKPVTIERLGLSIANALRICHLCRTIEHLEKRLQSGNIGISQSVPFAIFDSSSFTGDHKVRKLRLLEEDAIRFALNICGGSMSKAARSLGIGRSTLYRKVGEMERHKTKNNYISRENQTTRPIMEMSDIEHS